MSPWIIAGLCLVGSGFIAWGSARLKLRWPLMVLALLLMAIAFQLLFAARGRDGFHDLAAVVAQAFTVLPSLLGMAVGLAIAHVRRHKVRWRSGPGLVTAAAFASALGAAAATFLI